LTSDLSVGVPTTLIDVTASDVTVDLNGFHIRGTGGGGGDGVSSIASNVTVRNGSVGPVGNVGVNLTGSRARIEGVRVWLAFSGGIAAGFNSLVTGCSVANSSFGPGIETDGGSMVIANVATGNDSSGILVSDSTLVEGNTVSGNWAGITVSGAGTSVLRNVINGRSLSLSIAGDSAYGQNVLTGPAVTGAGVQIGPNICNGVPCP
jgi:parallel beta-helix repeat protein